MFLQKIPVLLLCLTAASYCLPGSFALLPDVPGTFYPFGVAEGDQIAPVNNDGSTALIPIGTDFPFFDQLHTSLYVNTNGVVSFLMPVSQSIPDTFPLGDNRQLLAPFWTDVDTEVNGGRIYYRQATDSEILARATQDIRDNFANLPQFQATWVFVSTWHQVTYHGGDSDSPVNSFQAVLITNGCHSFTIYNYGDITWPTGDDDDDDDSDDDSDDDDDDDDLGGSPVQAGYDAGDDLHFFNIPGSLQPEIVDVETTSNVGEPGRWVFRIDDADTQDGGCNTDECSLNIHECTCTPVSTGCEATCHDTNDSYDCSCSDGYVLVDDRTCIVDLIDECLSFPCLNGGTCINGYQMFTCICAPGSTGTACSLLDIDECLSFPCLNGGTCINGYLFFTCNCAPGHTGTTCDTLIP